MVVTTFCQLAAEVGRMAANLLNAPCAAWPGGKIASIEFPPLGNCRALRGRRAHRLKTRVVGTISPWPGKRVIGCPVPNAQLDRSHTSRR